MLTNKEKKANDILKILEKLYPKTPIPLSHKDPYTLLVAVVLSAQCTDERVNKITPLLFKEANNPKKMVKLGVRNIEKIIRPCGLSPQKSKSIHTLSKMLDKDHGSKVPENFKDSRIQDREKKVVVTCGLGLCAAIGGKLLKDMGFKNVSLLEGGVTKWQEDGFKLKKQS